MTILFYFCQNTWKFITILNKLHIMHKLADINTVIHLARRH